MIPPARVRRLLVRLAALVVAGAAVAPLVGAAVATAAAPARRTYYLALGASESLGMQPVGPGGHVVPTDEGYADALVAMERSRWPGLQLVHVGCPGITSQAALEGGGRCHFVAGSEVSAAVDFLRGHRGQTVLATVDLGFNDLWPCVAHGAVDQSCVTAALGRISRTLPVILRKLRAAGGHSMLIVGLLHNDPALAAYLQGPEGRAYSAGALSAVNRLNATLHDVYARAGVAVANVPSAFSLATSSPPAGAGALPADVVKVCGLSWMCSKGNIHLNAAGYAAVASAVAAALPRAGDGAQ